jgi:hypothetical protein
MRTRVVPLVFLTIGLVIAVAGEARADEPGGTRIALDLDYAVAIDEIDVDNGGGGALRTGFELDAVAVSLTPELSFGYHSFAGDFGPRLYRGTAGLRLSFLKVVEPGVFAHAGVGRASYDLSNGLIDPSRTAFTWDAGLTLDLTLLPVLEAGAHGAYNSLAAGDAERLEWATFGLHITLAL